MPLTAVLTITNEIGLHARPAARMVEGLAKFKSDVFLEKDGDRVNAKSIIGLLTLAAGHGTTLKAFVDGTDEQECMTFLTEFFANGFGEA